MLSLARAARSFGKLPSELLKSAEIPEIEETLALDFDVACAQRLSRFDREIEIDKFKIWSIMLGGEADSKSPSGMVKGRITEDTVKW